MLMSKEAYARHSGVSCQTVDDWVAGGAEVVMSRSKVKICSCVWGNLSQLLSWRTVLDFVKF